MWEPAPNSVPIEQGTCQGPAEPLSPELLGLCLLGSESSLTKQTQARCSVTAQLAWKERRGENTACLPGPACSFSRGPVHGKVPCHVASSSHATKLRLD